MVQNLHEAQLSRVAPVERRLDDAVEHLDLSLDRFLEVWPLLTSHDLLQALEACAGKPIDLYTSGPKDQAERVEILVDVTADRALVDAGAGGRWGRWSRTGSPARIELEDSSGAWVLGGTSRGSPLHFEAR
jgi:hypothetical protein